MRRWAGPREYRGSSRAMARRARCKEDCCGRKRQRSAEETGDQVSPPAKETGPEQGQGPTGQEEVSLRRAWVGLAGKHGYGLHPLPAGNR
jgi:hypothetical protein